MAQYRATIQGNKESSSRLGNPSSGIHATVNGWDSGVSVSGRTDGEKNDIFSITLTGGSNGRVVPIQLGELHLKRFKNGKTKLHFVKA